MKGSRTKLFVNPCRIILHRKSVSLLEIYISGISEFKYSTFIFLLHITSAYKKIYQQQLYHNTSIESTLVP